MTQNRRLLPYFLVPALPLLIPLVAMQSTTEVAWTPFDFAAAYVLLAGAGFVWRFATTHGQNPAYRAAVAVAVIAALLLIWINLAVGFIGNEENPANLLFGFVLLTGLVGAGISRLNPAGMSRTLFSTAAVQFLVPVVAFLIWRPPFTIGVAMIFLLNSLWVALFALSGLLFRKAAKIPPAPPLPSTPTTCPPAVGPDQT